jgi:hypothetical protein
MGLASVMGITAILIHSTSDFNLRIPANAALFVVLLALPWLASLRAEPDTLLPQSDAAAAAVGTAPARRW